MSYKVISNEQPVEVDIQSRKPFLHVKVGDSPHTVTESRCPAAGDFEITIDGRIYRGWRYASADEVYIRIDGRTHIIGLPQFGGGGAGAGGSADDIRADMPGTVVALHAAEGEQVTSGQKLVTIESMKLQIGVVAPRDGTVGKFHFQANTTFDRSAVLVSLVPLAPAPDDAKKAKS